MEVKSCDDCNIYHENSIKIQKPWVSTTKPFGIHIDYAGPFFTKNWLIIVDAYSIFPIIIPVKNITTDVTLKEIFKIISLYGIPETIVTDNGTNFTSKDFEKFCNNFGIKHVLTSAYHQQSNGQVERMVRTFKTHMKRNIKIDLDIALGKFLFNYRNTRNDTTGVTPSQRLFNQDIRIKWDILKPLEEKENKINVTLP
ncbi:unnamed protein product [Gordionus sp. m RMFG-2023]